MVFNITGVILGVALLVIVFVLISIVNKKEKALIDKEFIALFILLVIHMIGMILQILFSKTNIKPIYFDYITYISAVFLPVILVYIAITYNNKKVKLKKYSWLCIIPIISLLVLWTNDWHNLFYVKYSTNINEVQYGNYFYIHMIYSYLFLGITSVRLMVSSIRKSGFLSIQTVLILLGVLAPLVPNVLGSLKIIDMSIYVTPIMFTVTAICFYIAIIKLKALNVVPVATKTIIDNMTDSFIVLSEDGTIVDINKTCIDKFKPLIELKANMNLYQSMKKDYSKQLKVIKNDIKEAMSEKKNIDKAYHITIEEVDMYVDVDIQPIKAKYSSEYVAILLLIHDVTKEKKDMEIMTKNESLVILGELAGGVAHDVNTPISAIKSGVTMLKAMAKNDDEKMLLSSMDSCADKIIALVNSLRNQIRNIGSDTVVDISITTVINDIKIILNNELKKSNVTLEVDIKEDIHLSGNSTKLSQVVTNIVTNAIQAYNGQGGRVEVSAYKEENMAKISVQDHASGIPENIRPYIFKNILTTKGVSGTGFGLYLAYSVIKGAFGGDITFDTKTGEGTTFYISIPLN